MYKKYVDEIINMIFKNDSDYYDYDYDNQFDKRCNKIGHQIYNLYGYKGLYITTELVQQELMENEYSNEYIGYLRELEFAFSNICDEFQA